MQTIDLTNTTQCADFNLDVFCEKHYHQCVVSVVWRQIGDTHELIFASMELVPTFMAEDFEVAHQSKPIVRNIPLPDNTDEKVEEHSTIHYQRTIKSAQEGLDIFKRAKDDKGLHIEIVENGQFNQIFVTVSDSSGRTPLLSYLPSESATAYEYALPFGTNLYYGAQVCHLMPERSSDTLMDYISDENVDKWISDRIYWHLCEFEEYVQSINLILPNPYYTQSVPMNDVSTIGTMPLRSTIHFDRDCRNEQLQLTVFESINDALSFIKTIPITDTSIEILHHSILARQGYVITDRYDRIVELSPAAAPLLGINVSMGIENHRTRFINKNGQVEQELSIKSHEGFVCEDNRIFIPGRTLHDRLAHIKYRREQRESATGQIIYYKNQVQARCDIRANVNAAKHNILIIDPYFDSLAAQMYLPATNNNVSIRIIRNRSTLYDKQKRLKEEFIILSQELTSRFCDCEIEIAKDDKMHDRFLVIDDTDVWLLGSSMQSLGRSLSAMVKLKDSKTVIDLLNRYILDLKLQSLQDIIASASTCTKVQADCYARLDSIIEELTSIREDICIKHEVPEGTR